MSMRTKSILIGILFLFYFSRVNAQQQGPPPTVLHLIGGIQMERAELISIIAKADSSMVMKQSQDLNGLPNFIGRDNFNASVQLVGRDYEIVLAKWIFVFGDKNATMNGLTSMGYFAGSLGRQKCIDWLLAKIHEIGLDHNKPITEKKEFEFNRIAELTFDPINKTITLSFTPMRTINGF